MEVYFVRFETLADLLLSGTTGSSLCCLTLGFGDLHLYVLHDVTLWGENKIVVSYVVVDKLPGRFVTLDDRTTCVEFSKRPKNGYVAITHILDAPWVGALIGRVKSELEGGDLIVTPES